MEVIFEEVVQLESEALPLLLETSEAGRFHLSSRWRVRLPSPPTGPSGIRVLDLHRALEAVLASVRPAEE